MFVFVGIAQLSRDMKSTAPFWGAANLPEEVSRDIGYHSDSIVISRNMGPLGVLIAIKSAGSGQSPMAPPDPLFLAFVKKSYVYILSAFLFVKQSHPFLSHVCQFWPISCRLCANFSRHLAI